MILITLLAILMGSGVLAWAVAPFSKQGAKWIALLALLVDLVLVSSIWINSGGDITMGSGIKLD
jgi:NADH:ubiquinone oxidoreductase subunit 4 (subunit M)